MSRKSVVCVVDLETTGLANCDFVQLASVLYLDGQPETVEYFNSYAKPNQRIQSGAQAVHGISEQRVARCSTSAEVAKAWVAAVEDFAARHDGDPVLVGHNLLRFDLPIIYQHIPSLPYPTIDTLHMARRFDPAAPNHRLDFLVNEHYRLHPTLSEKAHDALADCYMVALLLRKYQDRPLQEFAKWAAAPYLLNLVPFGKHKGLPFARLSQRSLQWFLQKPDMDPDILYTVSQILYGQ